MGKGKSSNVDVKGLRLKSEGRGLFGNLVYHGGVPIGDYGDPVRGHFISIKKMIEKTIRFGLTYQVADPNSGKPAFSKTKLNRREFLGDLNFFVNQLELKIARAIDVKIVDKQFIKMIREKDLRNKIRIHLSTHKDDKLGVAIKVYQSIAVMAWIKVHRYLGGLITDRLVEHNFLMSYYFNIYALNDVDLNKSKFYKNAQDALDWLTQNEDFFWICGGLLKPSVVEVSKICSQLTEFPVTHNPVINSSSELSYMDDPMVRDVSLWSEVFLLGRKITLKYDPLDGQMMPDGDFTKYLRDISIYDLQQQIEIFEINLLHIDREKVKQWYESAKDLMEADLLLMWDTRLSELNEVMIAMDYCHDQIHCIGLMNADSGSIAEDVQHELIGKFLYLSRKIGEWIHDRKSLENLRNISERAKLAETHSSPGKGGLAYVTPPIHEPVIESISEKSTDLPAPTKELLDKFTDEEPKENVDEKIKELTHLLELSNEGSNIKCPVILKFLGYKTTKRGSTEKRKMGDKQGDLVNPEYKDREEGKVYSFPCIVAKQPDPGEIRDKINTLYPEEAVKYKGKIVKNAHPYWKEFCMLFPTDSRKKEYTGKHLGWKLVGNAKDGAFSDEVAEWLFKRLPEQTAYRLKTELRSRKGEPLAKPNSSLPFTLAS